MQPAAPREALLVRRAPGTLQRQTAALSSGPALLGVRSAGGGTQQVRRQCGVKRTPPSCTRLFPAESHPGRREKASPKGEASKLPVTLRRTSSSPCQSADHRLGSPKGSGAPLPSGPGSLQSSFRPQSWGTPSGPSARVRPSTFLPLTLFSSQGDFAATFWLFEALKALLLLA